jgi:hypothetical protein
MEQSNLFCFFCHCERSVAISFINVDKKGKSFERIKIEGKRLLRRYTPRNDG